MKAEKARIPIRDFIKVWCELCRIRIDAVEERTGLASRPIIGIVTQNSFLLFPSR